MLLLRFPKAWLSESGGCCILMSDSESQATETEARWATFLAGGGWMSLPQPSWAANVIALARLFSGSSIEDEAGNRDGDLVIRWCDPFDGLGEDGVDAVGGREGGGSGR